MFPLRTSPADTQAVLDEAKAIARSFSGESKDEALSLAQERTALLSAAFQRDETPFVLERLAVPALNAWNLVVQEGNAKDRVAANEAFLEFEAYLHSSGNVKNRQSLETLAFGNEARLLESLPSPGLSELLEGAELYFIHAFMMFNSSDAFPELFPRDFALGIAENFLIPFAQKVPQNAQRDDRAFFVVGLYDVSMAVLGFLAEENEEADQFLEEACHTFAVPAGRRSRPEALSPRICAFLSPFFEWLAETKPKNPNAPGFYRFALYFEAGK